MKIRFKGIDLEFEALDDKVAQIRSWWFSHRKGCTCTYCLKKALDKLKGKK